MRVFICVIVLTASCFAGVAETGLVTSRTVSDQSYGFPLFTVPEAYNEIDFCGSPLGVFEKESGLVHVGLAYRAFSLSNVKSADSGGEFAGVPAIGNLTVGKKNVLYILLNYGPAWLERKSAAGTLSLSPLHRFGLSVASEMPSKYLRFGIDAQGYYGTLGTSENQNRRTTMGLTRLAAYLGSQVHPLVRIGIFGGATGNFDSLQDETNATQQDRFFYGSDPVYGGDISVGKDGFPVKSSLGLTIASNHFVYVTKGIPHPKPEGNEDALVGDSLAWKWNTIGTFGRAGFEYSPALSLAYRRNRIQEYTPGEKNYPFQYGPSRGDTNWTFSSFSLGLGGSVLLRNYGTAWLEYVHEFFNAVYGAGTNTPNKSRGYDRIGLGLEGNVNAIPGLAMPKWVDVFLRLGYLNMRDNSRFGSLYGDEFGRFTPVSSGSQFADSSGFYSLSFGADERVNRFSLGAGARFFEKALGVDLAFAFLSRESTVKEGGFEFGIGVEYVLKAGKEKQ
jgi:hypothetical protein